MDEIIALLDEMASRCIGRDIIESGEVLDWLLDLRNLLLAPPVVPEPELVG